MPYAYTLKKKLTSRKELRERMDDYLANRPDTWEPDQNRAQHWVFMVQFFARMYFGHDYPKWYNDLVKEMTIKYRK